MLWLKWNIFRGGFDYYRDEETAKQISEAQEIARNTNRQVEAAVRLAYNAFATARDRLPSLDRYVKASDATRDAYSKQFAIGQRTLLDLLDSENEYFTSRSTYVNALFIELSARFRVLNAMGNLMQALDIKPPQEGIARVASSMMPPEEKQAEAPKAQKTAASEQPAAFRLQEQRAQEKPAQEKRSEVLIQPTEAMRAPEPRSEVMQPVRVSENKAVAPTPIAQAPVARVEAPALAPAPAPAPAAVEPPAPSKASASVEERRLTLQD
jgi:adhesin transport system outer membrane protein